MSAGILQSRAATLEPLLDSPSVDIAPLMSTLFTSLGWYVARADEMGVFACMAHAGAARSEEIAAATPLSVRGAEALLGVLCGLDLVRRWTTGEYVLAPVAREYLDPQRQYYLGLSLRELPNGRPFPEALLKNGKIARLSEATHDENPDAADGFGSRARLDAQHNRNFPSAVVAARTGMFGGLRHLVDVGGGSGVFAVPLALDHPQMRITLLELPRGRTHIASSLARYGVLDRVDLVGWNVFETPWPVEKPDGILLGNLMHGCDDDECRALLHEAFDRLVPGGRLLIHEVLWNANKDGPMFAALFNFSLAASSGGCQRTRAEFDMLLIDAGFGSICVTPGAGGFSLIGATKAS
ncbi:MAG TPA: methyltransferase [Vicinamibacterales bacterium]|nr:methyltransferase [Vicinamibacterales bacterium]